MLKYSKVHLSLMATLGLMITSQIGLVLYKGLTTSKEDFYESALVQGGAAKAFGLIIPHEKHVHVNSVRELDHVFHNWGYTLKKEKAEQQVPRLYLAKLPKDMAQKNKKSSNLTFIQVLLPHILTVNESILKDRQRLVELQKQQKVRNLRHSEKMWLRQLAAEYRCKSTKVEALLAHVDVVPPSLALAQAILETGGGRSSAALRKNSTFGHMKSNNKVREFASLYHNVKAYVDNLNRHAAYGSFRRVRADLRAKNQPLCGIKLAAGLDKYSTRRGAYIHDVQDLIRKRKLDQYNDKTLGKDIRLKP